LLDEVPLVVLRTHGDATVHDLSDRHAILRMSAASNKIPSTAAIITPAQ
jgi:hypothetical protein